MNKLCDSSQSEHEDHRNTFVLPTDRSNKMPRELQCMSYASYRKHNNSEGRGPQDESAEKEPNA